MVCSSGATGYLQSSGARKRQNYGGRCTERFVRVHRRFPLRVDPPTIYPKLRNILRVVPGWGQSLSLLLLPPRTTLVAPLSTGFASPLFSALPSNRRINTCAFPLAHPPAFYAQRRTCSSKSNSNSNSNTSITAPSLWTFVTGINASSSWPLQTRLQRSLPRASAASSQGWRDNFFSLPLFSPAFSVIIIHKLRFF